MEIIKTITYILAGILLCIAWFITFALGYILQGTWAGAAFFVANAAVNIAIASRIETGDGEENRMIYNDYIFNKDFRKYVDSYCKEHGLTVDEALKQDDVKCAWRRYTEV